MNLDWIILNKIQGAMSSGFMDMIMPKITLLGSAGIIWIIIGVALLISKKHRRIGFLVLIGLLLELIIGNGILKNLVERLFVPIGTHFCFGYSYNNISFIQKRVGLVFITAYSFNSIFQIIFVCTFSIRCIGRSSAWSDYRLYNILCRKQNYR